MTDTSLSKPTVFISYSHKDKAWKDRLLSHLGVLSEQGLLTLWEDRQIGAGEDWYEKIQEAMNAATVAIILISANSLTSKFILHEEVSRLLQRRDQEGLLVFPVILKSCPWQKVDWLSRMQVRPRDGKPLASLVGNRRDEALSNIATEVYEHFNLANPEPLQRQPPSPHSNRINITRLPITGSDLFGRQHELQKLDEAWESQRTHIVSLVAWGGVGKSSLVNHWLGRMAEHDYRGASRVYGWSFYSQGTTDRAISADQFIETALTWFGDTDPNRGSPWDKGERLAQLIGAERSLLVLDGVEPLQYPPGPDEGRLKDQALQSLLRQLAAYNKGLCVISTRVMVSDLSSFEGRTANRIDLDMLSPQAGAQVLKAQGVRGAEVEIEKTSEEFGGHSLALTLLGSYLSDVCEGDVSRRGEVKGLEDDERHGRHAQKVMASYEKWFGDGPELAVLNILALFNRPADGKAISVLRKAPIISGLTDWVRSLSDSRWQQVLARLRRAKLLAERDPTQPDHLDTHPLVREHFGGQLKRERLQAWRAGHNRLYEHLKRTTKVFPNTLDEMFPLYAAIAHGCEAGRHEDALRKVYVGRVSRGDEYFSKRVLGAFGSDLAALANFFETPWLNPIAELGEHSEYLGAFVLNEAAACLSALGHPDRSIEVSKAAVDRMVAQELWSEAGSCLNNLVSTALLIGNSRLALSYAEESLVVAEREDELSSRSRRRCLALGVLASVFLHTGRLAGASVKYKESEEVHQMIDRSESPLPGLHGFRYCDLLLELGNYQEVQKRATETIKIASQQGWTRDVGLDHLSTGRAALLESQVVGTRINHDVSNHLDESVRCLQQARSLDLLPLALLGRAWMNRLLGAFAEAGSDLGEAMSISTRGGMGPHQADCHLEYARLHLAISGKGEGDVKQENRENARAHWTTAKEMIERMGYHRRDKDLLEIRQELRVL